MTKLLRTRLVLLVATLVAVSGGTLLGVQHAWRRISAMERQLSKTHLESFRLAEDFEGRLRYLNQAILKFAARRQDATWEEYLKASTNLDHWIDQYDPRVNPQSIVTTARERRIFQEINASFDGFLQASRNVRTNDSGPIMTQVAFDQIQGVQAQAERLLELKNQLADAHREAERVFLAEANRSLDNVRAFLFGAVVITLALVGLLGLVIYRDMIAPLRIKLVQSEALLERQEKLATLGTLAAGIAHEIRNPLTSIKARLYTLGKHIRDNPAGLADAEVISGEISRLERIVQEVLQFARPSEPRLDVVRADRPLIEVQALVASSVERREIRVVFEPGPELHALMDAALIKQVLLNLVRNATEAIEGPGTVTLRARPGTASLQGRTQPVVILEVTDTGKGISPEVEQRLFDPFFTTKEAGTGLGLSIAARIVEKHGGALQYQTHLGHGTTFGIVLPAASPPPAPGSPAASRRPDAGH